MKNNDLIEGNIFKSLILFALPVLLSLFLQALYGGVDLLVVGKFAKTVDVSGVATGSMLLATATCVITGLSMGITVLVGKRIGEKSFNDAGRAIGAGIFVFILVSVIATILLVFGSGVISSLLNAPKEAFTNTSNYIRICGFGSIFIVAYNVLGSIFRGIGDSKTPFITVSIACVVNVFADILLVYGFNLGSSGTAIATVFSQGISVLISIIIIKRRKLPFDFKISYIRHDAQNIKDILKIGVPIALQELLVSISFLVIITIVNAIGLVESAGIGVAEKLCMFIMLVPSAFMQSMSAFVAQNIGAKKPHRANKALFYGIVSALAIGVIMCVLSFLKGDSMSSVFSSDTAVIKAGHEYLKAYAIDCVLTPFLFCFIGYFNGREKTFFVMLQGIIGAFLVRIPVCYFVSKMPGVTLFQIGLSTPCSTIVQIILCVGMFIKINRKSSKNYL